MNITKDNKTIELSSANYFNYPEKKKFLELTDFSNTKPYKDLNESYIFFEPKPKTFSEDTLEGCLANQSKIDIMNDKKNLYHCELCTEDKYGKNSKKLYKAQALKRYLMLEPPKSLIINLKRFSQTGVYF